MSNKSQLIAQQNDAFRKANPLKCAFTPGILAMGADHLPRIIALVRDHTDFAPGNDPYGEHDFGAFDYEGDRIIWKIDYYDSPEMEYGSEDPSDPSTVRVMTIMLASEY